MASRRRRLSTASEGAPAAAPAAPAGTPEAASQPSPASLAALAVLAFGGALWSLLLWTELAGRTAGTGTCLLGGSSCAALWEAPFAASVHRWTSLPLAAWGLAWSVASFALPLTALVRRAEGRVDPALATGARLLGASGLLAVFVLVAVMLAARAFCAACSLMHALVAGYAGIVLFGWPRLGLPALRRGALLMAGSVGGAALALVYPARSTPPTGGGANLPPVSAGAAGSVASPTAAPASPDEVAALVSSLAPSLQQVLADSLFLYRVGPHQPLWPPRGLQGPAVAPVRLTEFTDVLCSHCAELHRTLQELRERLPPGSFSVEPRQFPLDAACNPWARGRLPDPVRCVAAKVQICLADDPRAEELAGVLFARQKGLTAEKVYELAAPFRRRRELEACVESPATGARLQEDVRLAAGFEPEGTPLVLVNGRKATSFGPFLYAMVLTLGSPDHPAFAALPAPNPNPHLH
jgi:serine/threonine-protein kinase